MITRPGKVLLITLGWFFAFSGIVWANSLAPFVWLWPGIIVFTGWASIVATVLAAVIERPFVSAAGLKSHPLAYSLQANAISLLGGVLAALIINDVVFSPLALLVPFAAVTCSIVVESAYLKIQAQRQNVAFRKGPIILGNLCSSFVLIAVSACLDTQWAMRLPWDSPGLWSKLERLQSVLAWSVGLFAVVLLGSFRVGWNKSSPVAEASVNSSSAPVLEAQIAPEQPPVD